jgi:hypothetical protein
MWFENATGYSEKFLDEVKKSLNQSNFPQVEFADAHVKSGGCLGLIGTEQFDAVHISSRQEDLKDLGCLYKSSEFGNLVLVSLLMYNKKVGFFEILKRLFKLILTIFTMGMFSKGSTIKEEEYKEVFNRLLFMAINEAAGKLGVDPLQVEFDTRPGGSSSARSASGLSGLMNNFKKQ